MNISFSFAYQRYVLKDVTPVTEAVLHPITASVNPVGLVTTVRKVFRLSHWLHCVQKST